MDSLSVIQLHSLMRVLVVVVGCSCTNHHSNPNVFNDSLPINPHRDDLLSSSGFTPPLDSLFQTHIYFQIQLLRSPGVTGTPPKKGDFLFELSISQFVVDQNIWKSTLTEQKFRRFLVKKI